MTCSYCATELPAGAMFCGECGRSVSAKLTTTPVGSRLPASVAVPPPSQVIIPDWNSAAPETTPVEVVNPLFESAPVAAPTPAPAPPVAPVIPAPTPTTTSAPPIAPVIAEPEPVRPTPAPPISRSPLSRPPVDAPAPGDTVALDSASWGNLEPLPADLEETRIVGRSSAQRFVLQFSTGESVSVSGSGLIGRNPIAEPGERFDAHVTISDPGKSVSKTHLEFGQEAGQFWISDRFSGNGTVLREPEKAPKRCEAGKRYRLARGSRVDMGEQFFIVS